MAEKLTCPYLIPHGDGWVCIAEKNKQRPKPKNRVKCLPANERNNCAKIFQAMRQKHTQTGQRNFYSKSLPPDMENELPLTVERYLFGQLARLKGEEDD